MIDFSSMLAGSMKDDEIIAQFEEMTAQPFTVDQVVEGAKAMREVMIPVELSGDPVDTCGTGGSGLKTINTSTLVAFIIAAAGGEVAKHGNRSASGNCGSFDLLESIGARIDLTPEQEQEIYDELDMVFLFAKDHHPAMRHVASARKKFGKKTIFNLLGPLCNPAGVRKQIVGTGKQEDSVLIAQALKQLGSEHSLVVTGSDGLDEISVCDTTTVLSVSDEEAILFEPQQFQVIPYDVSDIEGGSVEDNIRIFWDLLAGKGVEAHRDLVCVNAAFALLLSEQVESLMDGFVITQELLKGDAVRKLVHVYIQASNDV